MRIFALLFCCALAIAKDLQSNENPKVYSPVGIYEGSMLKTISGKDIYSFRGIRYAQQPTGLNRFKQAIKEEPHQGIYDATHEGPICPQFYKGDLEVSEDCLFLNVYTPELPQNSSDSSILNQPTRPVVVFIHGGSFISSSGSFHDLGPQLVLDEDLVFVTLNYRLGALGFLSTGDSRAPGNAGLKDQVLALKWIQQNIAAFGGNPNLVTLMGHGAGSQCISLHIVSPMSKGLFHRAIMMSGATTTQNPLPTKRDHLIQLQAQALGCPFTTPDIMFDCFYTKTPVEFVNSSMELINADGNSDPIHIPVVEQHPTQNNINEEAFLTEQPVDIIRQGKANFVPLYIGVNRDEHGSYVISMEEQAQRGNTTSYDAFNNKWEERAPKHFAYESGTAKSLIISRKFKSFYLNDEPVKAGNYQGIAQLYADALTIYHVHRFERLMANYSSEPIWYYHNMHENCDTYAKWSNGTRFGIVHYDELSLLLRVAGRPAHCEKDAAAAGQVWKYVSNFAETANTTPPNKANEFPLQWLPSTKDQPQYLEFSDNSKMVQGVIYPERMNVWDELFPVETQTIGQ